MSTSSITDGAPTTPAADALAAARRVLRLGAQALAGLAEALDARFAEAVAAPKAVRGRVVVSGTGKWGHVARKIAAAFASTGAPALFVHPADASHGDLGEPTRADAALVLSNSGETAELSDIVRDTRRFGIPLIGVASNADSNQLKAAEVALPLPRAEEACVNGLGPTTSTTLSLALGDALAVALMERRRFTADDYRALHPGGKLGAMLLRVRDLMHDPAEPPLVAADAPMRAMLPVMSACGFGIAGVVDADSGLAGVISNRDLPRHMDAMLERRAGGVAAADPVTVGPEAPASAAMAPTNEGTPRILSLLVVDPHDAGRRPLGLIHIHDRLRAGLA